MLPIQNLLRYTDKLFLQHQVNWTKECNFKAGQTLVSEYSKNVFSFLYIEKKTKKTLPLHCTLPLQTVWDHFITFCYDIALQDNYSMIIATLLKKHHHYSSVLFIFLSLMSSWAFCTKQLLFELIVWQRDMANYQYLRSLHRSSMHNGGFSPFGVNCWIFRYQTCYSWL